MLDLSFKRLAFEEILQIATDHHAHHALVSNITARNLARVLSVTQHHRTIRKLYYFMHPVRNVDDADVLGFEIFHQLEQSPSFTERQTRRRLVHDGDARSRAERTRDLDELLLCD